jgi:AraC-like DNA-binding protein/mannose-6-phosphate isomerase-like protein (cupin superfamily)
MAVLLESIRFAPGELLRLLRWDGDARVPLALEAGGRIASEAGMGSRWHSHSEFEFTVVTRGSGLRYVGDHVQAFADMDCVLVGSHVPHCWMEQGRTAGYALQFHLPPEPVLEHLGGGREVKRLSVAAGHGLSFGPAVAEAALALFDRMAAGSKLARAGLLLELLALLQHAQPADAMPLSQARVTAAEDGAARPRMDRVVQWILERFSQPLTLDEAVKRSGMSRATFCRQFVKHTGKTFVAFVTDARLAHAHQLLTHTTRPIADIAFASGFGSLTRFNAAFHARFARAPRELRGAGRPDHRHPALSPSAPYRAR